jgi:hypothetical protein
LLARILEIIESLDTLRASPEMEIIHEVEKDESVIDRITAAQPKELEREVAGLKAVAREALKEIEELVELRRFRKKTRSETLRRRTAARRHSHAGQAAEDPRDPVDFWLFHIIAPDAGAGSPYGGISDKPQSPNPRS